MDVAGGTGQRQDPSLRRSDRVAAPVGSWRCEVSYGANTQLVVQTTSVFGFPRMMLLAACVAYVQLSKGPSFP